MAQRLHRRPWDGHTLVAEAVTDEQVTFDAKPHGRPVEQIARRPLGPQLPGPAARAAITLWIRPMMALLGPFCAHCGMVSSGNAGGMNRRLSAREWAVRHHRAHNRSNADWLSSSAARKISNR
ncbi:hypothetical protein GCM10023195_66990 [Actinoallomurus liliacearum]|uniref:Uncharacterized protein n=1 Tax=Actinoallomurus liliacearum TaxID=1080073 RepID=A0ABP8TS84_9ACTN